MTVPASLMAQCGQGLKGAAQKARNPIPLATLSSPTSELLCCHGNRVPAPSKGKPLQFSWEHRVCSPYLGVELLLLFHCPGRQEPATPRSERRPQGAGEEGSGCLLYSNLASVWHSL